MGPWLKTLDTRACVSFPGGQYSVCIVIHWCWENNAVLTSRGPDKGCLASGPPSRTLPPASLSCAYHNLYPFPIINHNYKHTPSVHSWVPEWGLDLRRFCTTPPSQLVSERGCPCLEAVSPEFMGWPKLHGGLAKIPDDCNLQSCLGHVRFGRRSICFAQGVYALLKIN